jgi:hypothetical protein
MNTVRMFIDVFSYRYISQSLEVYNRMLTEDYKRVETLAIIVLKSPSSVKSYTPSIPIITSLF